MKRLVVVMVIVVVGCLVWLVYQQSSKAGPPTARGPGEAVMGPERYGKPEAPIKVEAYYPLNEDHQFIVDYLRLFAEARPEQVSVVIYDMQSTIGRERWSATGLTCAGLIINGKTTYEITTEEGPQTVSFIKRPGAFWTEEDFEAVIDQLLEEGGKAADAG